jgi:ABC-type polysaccharide/polyol phosphate transport system ATPase subunit
MSTETAIRLNNISKDFRIYHEKSNLFTDRFLNSLKRKNKYETLHILKNISFEIKRGQMVGIIGKNGAGKTTLLKIIAGILKPTTGSISLNGKSTPFLELGVGFNQDLTAIDNIILYGLILGFSKKEIISKVSDVLKYAELEKFGDIPIKNFSKGMHARLAFSTAILVDPDILLIDEILSVGDYSFQQKSYNTFLELKNKKKTIVFVSHSLDAVRKLCDEVILLYEGKIEAKGEPNQVIRKYLELYYQNNANNINPAPITSKDPDQIFQDNSTFFNTAMDNTSPHRLKWRAQTLISNNIYAIKEKTILDLGSHDGRFIYASLKCGAKFVQGIEWRQNLVDISSVNLDYYTIDKQKYTITQSDFFNTLQNISPGTFDTILCLGVLEKIVNHADLIGLIARLNPTYLIIDSEVANYQEPAISLTTEDPVLEKNTIRGDGIVGIPSKAALEMILSKYDFHYTYIDWQNTGVSDWSQLEDYKNQERVSLIATRESKIL